MIILYHKKVKAPTVKVRGCHDVSQREAGIGSDSNAEDSIPKVLAVKLLSLLDTRLFHGLNLLSGSMTAVVLGMRRVINAPKLSGSNLEANDIMQ